MDSAHNDPNGPGCPIRISPDQSSLSAPRGFSQSATSFIAFTRQGIHQMPFLHLRENHPCARDQSPASRTLSHSHSRKHRHVCQKNSLPRNSQPPPRARTQPPRRQSTDPQCQTTQRQNPQVPPPKPQILPTPSRLDTQTGGGDRDRTDDLLLAKQALSQLSYAPLGSQRPENR